PAEQVALVPATAVDLGEGREATTGAAPGLPPWPGALPAPSPAVLEGPEEADGPAALEVLDAAGRPVAVDGRGGISAPPARVGGSQVVAWAGPWPVEERWWDPARHRRRARLQVLTADGVARL